MQNDPTDDRGTVIERDVSEELLSTHMKLVQSTRIVQRALNLDVEEARLKAKMDEESKQPEASNTQSTDSDAASETPSSDSPASDSSNTTEKITDKVTEPAGDSAAKAPLLLSLKRCSQNQISICATYQVEAAPAMLLQSKPTKPMRPRVHLQLNQAAK